MTVLSSHSSAMGLFLLFLLWTGLTLIVGNGRFLLALGVVANHHHGQEDTGYLAEPACTSEHEECPGNQSDYA